jgi:multicomponent Na+:H+ antiporter subunit E
MRRLTLFIASLVIWYLLTWPYDLATRTMDWQMLIAGVLVSIAASLLLVRVFTRHPLKLYSPARWFWALCYAPVLLYYMIIANLDVAYRVIHPLMPIRPGIVKVKTVLSSESARTALANSITLTPGTLTVDIGDDGTMYVHCINVRETEVEAATREIVARFEPLLRRIFD